MLIFLSACRTAIDVPVYLGPRRIWMKLRGSSMRLTNVLTTPLSSSASKLLSPYKSISQIWEVDSRICELE